MKKNKFISIILLLVSNLSFGQFQEVKTEDGRTAILNTDGTWKYKISEKNIGINAVLIPEYSLRPYYVDNGKLKSFEKVKAKSDYKTKFLGYGGFVIYLTTFGKKSNIRFQKGKIPKILIKLEGGEEPEDYITILKSEKIKRKKRRFKQSSMAFGGRTRDVSGNEISFKLNKIESNIYELVIDEGIKVGEYAVIPVIRSSGDPLSSYASTRKIYCFAIDN